jgi:hypothetical protein
MFLEILPRIETHAQLWFRYLRCPGKRDDHIAEAIALSWKWFVRAVEAGKDPTQFVSVLATLVVKAVRSGRRLCGQRTKDVMSPLAQRKRGFTIECLSALLGKDHQDLYGDPHGQDRLDAFEERLRDNTQTPVIDQVVFRCDFPTWIHRLSDRKRRVADDLMAGECTGDVASKHGLSAARVSQMRRELHQAWRHFCGEWSRNSSKEVRR